MHASESKALFSTAGPDHNLSTSTTKVKLVHVSTQFGSRIEATLLFRQDGATLSETGYFKIGYFKPT